MTPSPPHPTPHHPHVILLYRNTAVARVHLGNTPQESKIAPNFFILSRTRWASLQRTFRPYKCPKTNFGIRLCIETNNIDGYDVVFRTTDKHLGDVRSWMVTVISRGISRGCTADVNGVRPKWSVKIWGLFAGAYSGRGLLRPILLLGVKN